MFRLFVQCIIKCIINVLLFDINVFCFLSIYTINCKTSVIFFLLKKIGVWRLRSLRLTIFQKEKKEKKILPFQTFLGQSFPLKRSFYSIDFVILADVTEFCLPVITPPDIFSAFMCVLTQDRPLWQLKRGEDSETSDT